jgi:hypothetical protein
MIDTAQELPLTFSSPCIFYIIILNVHLISHLSAFLFQDLVARMRTRQPRHLATLGRFQDQTY